MYMLWFNFILGLNSIFFCFKLIIIHYHTQNQKKINFIIFFLFLVTRQQFLLVASAF